MSNPYKKYAGYAYRELRSKLLRDGEPPETVDLTIANIKLQRSAQSIAKRQKKESDRQWGEVIEALQHERRIVRSMVRYKTKTPAPERAEFVANYFVVLNKLYEKLEKQRRIDRELPAHSHWTDFVPERIKEAFRVAADEVPPRDRAKFKQPFQRTSPIDLCNKRRARLLRYTRATLETVIERLDEDPDNEKAIRKEWLLRKAIDRANALEDNAHVPNHWAQLVPDLLRSDDDDSMQAVVKAKPPKKRASLASTKLPPPLVVQKLTADLAAQRKQRSQLMDRQSLGTTLKQMLAVTEKRNDD
jgi:hypothetical protein